MQMIPAGPSALRSNGLHIALASVERIARRFALSNVHSAGDLQRLDFRRCLRLNHRNELTQNEKEVLSVCRKCHNNGNLESRFEALIDGCCGISLCHPPHRRDLSNVYQNICEEWEVNLDEQRPKLLSRSPFKLDFILHGV